MGVREYLIERKLEEVLHIEGIHHVKKRKRFENVEKKPVKKRRGRYEFILGRKFMEIYIHTF